MSDPLLSRLRWRCRRGMRELDVLLERFLSEQYSAASPATRAAFARLISHSDEEILALLFGHRPAQDPELRDVVERLSCGARNPPR